MSLPSKCPSHSKRNILCRRPPALRRRTIRVSRPCQGRNSTPNRPKNNPPQSQSSKIGASKRQPSPSSTNTESPPKRVPRKIVTGGMQIFIRTLTGKVFTLDVDQAIPILDVKELIFDKENN
eukprot:GABV01003488.1.p1 GENE.GABV01003488.1~~GABV01003488.1.p1  ORF type:complete len:122 (+),score=22.08 GABV01003488.1:126-491(+)